MRLTLISFALLPLALTPRASMLGPTILGAALLLRYRAR